MPLVPPPPRPRQKQKASHVGVPAIFKLELACKHITAAFDEDGCFGCYLVGSALERADWRDVDIVFIMSDEAFRREFPKAVIGQGAFEFDPKWLLNSITLSTWMREQTGLPVDFKIQPQSWANERHKGPRSALGLTFARPEDD